MGFEVWFQSGYKRSNYIICLWTTFGMVVHSRRAKAPAATRSQVFAMHASGFAMGLVLGSYQVRFAEVMVEA